MFFSFSARTVRSAVIASVLFLSCSKSKDVPITAPTANFSYSGAGTAPSTVRFTNSSSGATSYQWDFGDGITSTSTDPSHTYTRGGVFTVRLTAINSSGSNSITKTVNISAPTSVKIMGVKVLGMPFTDASGGGWDPSTGPDVYYAITDAANNVLHQAPTFFVNVTPTSLPLGWVLATPYQVTNFATQYKIILWDDDDNDFPPSADDFIGGYSFTFLPYTTAGYPSVVTLQSSSSTVKIELLLQWQ